MFEWFFLSPALWLASSPEAFQLPLTMLIVFGSAKLCGELFERFGQPGIAGEILAGTLIGPGVLGWIQPDEFLHALSELGVMFLLFRVGMEVKTSDLVKVGRTAILVAVLGVAIPFAMGWLIMNSAKVPQVEATFVGAALVATSIGITAQVLAAKGCLQHTAAKIILAAAIIDDILGLLVLGVVSSMAKGSINVFELLLTAGLAVGFTALVVAVGSKTVERLMPKMEARLKYGEVQFSLALVLLFGLSVLSVYAGVAAIIGAFLAGVAMSPAASHRLHDLAQGVSEFLVPFFLAGIGMNLNLRDLANPATLWLAVAITAAAVFSKFGGCGLGAMSLGWKNAMRIGAGMVPRGEVGMVVAQIGLKMAVISSATYTIVVFMAVATTLLAPPLLAWTFRGAETSPPEERYSIG